MRNDFRGRRLWLAAAGLLMAVSGAMGFAQDGPGGPPPPMQSNRPPMERAFHGYGDPGHGGMGRWWDNPDVAKNLNLGADQKQKIDDIVQQNRMRLIDLHASLQKEEATLDPLMSADSPDETKILAQIDKVAQARSELEKSNARMLLAMRQVLTADQWTKLKALRAQRMARRPGNGGPGPGGEPGSGPA